MSELALLLRDFHAPHRPADTRLLPRLPALEVWLSRATARPAGIGWRDWLARAVLGADAAALGAGANWAAQGLLSEPAGRHFWFATPVHYLAGLDTVHLRPGGLLRLPPEEQHALVADFAQLFGDTHWRLHALGYRELLLEGPDPGAHDTTEPAAVIGGDLGAAQPRGSGTRPLRQLAAEVEMWLHEHTLNRERARRGELPLTGLWFWGAGTAGRAWVAPRADVWSLYGNDAFSAGVSAVAHLPLRPLPETALVAAAAPAVPRTAIVLPAGGESGAVDLPRLEREWFEPLLADLRAGRWSALTLVHGGRSHRLRRAHRWRRWRRLRAWWEDLPP